MNKFFLIPIFALIFISGVIAQSEVSYVLTLNYDGKTLAVDSFTLVEGKGVKDIFEPSEGFTIKVLDKNDEVLYSEVFIADLTSIREAPDYFFDDSGEQVAFEDTESPKETKETSIVLTIPYFEEAEKIQIYNLNNQLTLEFLIDEEFNETGFDFNNLKTIIGVLIILILIGIIIYKRKVIVEKIKKILKKEEKRIVELEKSIEEHKKHIEELKKKHEEESKKHKKKTKHSE